MKKLLFTILILMAAVNVYAAGPCTSSGAKTADGSVYSGKATMCDLTVTTDGTNACTIICYDNASAASGTALFATLTCSASSASCMMTEMNRAATNGIYCDITTSGTCTYTVGRRSGW